MWTTFGTIIFVVLSIFANISDLSDQKPTDARDISQFTEDRKGDVIKDIPCLRPKVFSTCTQSCQMVRSSKDLTLE